MFKQLSFVQSGAWIYVPPVSPNTITEIFSQGIMGLSADGVTGWMVPLFIGAVAVVIAVIMRTWGKFSKTEKCNIWFLATLALVPPLLLAILSLPPMKPTFIPRYVTYSIALIMPLIAIFLAFAPKIKNKTFAFASMLLIPCCATIGIVQADTRTVESDTVNIVAEVKKASNTTEPIFINADELNIYDAFFYETERNPIYGTKIDYKWKSLDPIREYGMNEAGNIEERITDIDSFWYVTYDAEEEVAFNGFAVYENRENNSYRAFRFVKN